MCYAPYNPPRFLQNSVAMTVYTALWGRLDWQGTTAHLEPPYHKTIFIG